jgi:hypothetical protein
MAGSRIARSACLSLVAGVLHAQGSVQGVVRDGMSGHVLRDALVRVVGTDRVATTDVLGRYRLEHLTTGQVTLQLRRIGYIARDTVVAATLDTTRLVDVALAPRAIDVMLETWLGCRAVPPIVRCSAPRAIMLGGYPQPGVWRLRSAREFGGFVGQRDLSPGDRARIAAVDWRRELLVAVGYGGQSGCGPEPYVNRIERRRDTIVVVVGPDSIRTGDLVTCLAYFEPVDVVVVPRTRGPLIVRHAHREWRPVPPDRAVPH